MQTDILHRFLDNRLINIGSDDERLTRLRASAGTIAESIKAQPERVPRLAMVAFDPRVTANDPVMNEVADAVSANWTTYTSVFADRPVVLFRAVLLEALRLSQQDDAEIAGSIALTARNMLPLVDLGRENTIWQDLTARSEEALAEGAASHWSVVVNEAPAASTLPPPPKPAKFDRKQLLSKIEAAVGPQNEKGEPLTNPNPHWPNTGNPWSFMFAPRMSNAIGEALDTALETILANRSASDQAMQKAMQSFVTNVMPGFLRAGQAMERKIDLLWWRQTMYSNAARCSYRTMKPEAAAVQMAIDVFKATPPFCPTSVEYFLREAVAEAFGEGKGRTASLTLKQIASSKPIRSEVVADGLPFSLADGPGRRPLISVLLGSGDAEEALGLPGATKLTLDDLAVWLLREAQAAALVSRRKPS